MWIWVLVVLLCSPQGGCSAHPVFESEIEEVCDIMKSRLEERLLHTEMVCVKLTEI